MVYVFGGSQKDGVAGAEVTFMKDMHVYDQKMNRWSEIPNLNGPSGRWGHKMEWSHIDHNIYIVGGNARRASTSNVNGNAIDIWEFSAVSLKFIDLTEKTLANAAVSSNEYGGSLTGVPGHRSNFGWAYSGVPGKMILYGGYRGNPAYGLVGHYRK